MPYTKKPAIDNTKETPYYCTLRLCTKSAIAPVKNSPICQFCQWRNKRKSYRIAI